MSSRVWVLLGLIFAALIVDPHSFCLAQTAGTISGAVRDPGGIVPGADVLLTSQARGVKATTLTDEAGYYQFLAVPVGIYSLTVSVPGFKSSQVSEIKVDIRSNRIVDFLLEVGEMTETVVVEASLVAQVELRSGEVANLVPSEQVTELPLNGRNFQQLAVTVPGVSVAEWGDRHSTHIFSAAGSISSSGGTSDGNMWIVDGSNNTDPANGTASLVFPSIDSIAEFKIQRNSYGAELPAGTTAQMNVVTRAGGNRFHGTLYEFHRNDNLNATDFFLNRAGEPRQPLAYNNFGYTAGGPILKDKAFFFWSQEWRVERRGTPRQALVPTELERDGDFSGPNSGGFNDPLNPYTGLAFPGNRIPRDWQSPAGRAFMAIYPRPTLALDAPRFAGYNWLAAPSSNTDTRQESIRLDYHLSDRHMLMGRYTRDQWTHGDPTWGYEAGGAAWGDDAFPSIDSEWRFPSHNITTQWTTVFGPTSLNQVSFNWSSNELLIRPGPGQELSQALNAAIPEVFPGPEQRGHAALIPYPYGNIYQYPPFQNRSDLLAWKDDFSSVFGRHTVRLGGLFSQGAKDEDLYTEVTPLFYQFLGGAVPGGAGIGGGWGPPNAPGIGELGIVTGNLLADLLLKGTYWGAGAEADRSGRGEVRWRDYEVYARDTWRLAPRLTLDLGLRWSYLPNPWQAHDDMGNFILALYDPKEGATPTNGMIRPEDTRGIDVNTRSLVRNHYFDFAPRVGLAWDPTGRGRWSIRAGAGIFYSRNSISEDLSLPVNPPTITRVQWSWNGASVRPLDSLPEDVTLLGSQGVAQNGKSINAESPGSYQWNLTIERELHRDTKLEVAYVGNRGYHLPGGYWMNTVAPEDRQAAAVAFLRQEDPSIHYPMAPLSGTGHGPLVWGRGADSWYHSLQAHLVRRFSRRLSYQASYTWSKLLSTSPRMNVVSAFTDTYNTAYDKGRPDFDRPHIVSANLIYQTPALGRLGRGLGQLLGNWETTAIFSAASGWPYTISVTDQLTGTVGNRPDLVGDPNAGPKTVDRWFNTAAFALRPKLGELGRSPVGAVRGPGIQNLDFGLNKDFDKVRWFTPEGARIQFRAEFFNAFNKTQFRYLDTNFSVGAIQFDKDAGRILSYEMTNPNFGRVYGAREAREIQVGLKIIW